jgi:hypothetical protein
MTFSKKFRRKNKNGDFWRRLCLTKKRFPRNERKIAQNAAELFQNDTKRRVSPQRFAAFGKTWGRVRKRKNRNGEETDGA